MILIQSLCIIIVCCMCLFNCEFRMKSVEFTQICEDTTYGTVLYRDTSSANNKMTCGIMCANTANCTSYTFDTTLNACELNSDSYNTSTVGSCESYVTYGLVQPTITWCLSGTPCTNTVQNMRLCDGGGVGVCDPAQGRLEIFYNGSWGSICDDFWDDSDYTYEYYSSTIVVRNAQVVCRIFGFGNGTSNTEAFYGSGPALIWLDNVNCNGTEPSLDECPSDGWGEHNCADEEHVGVTCSTTAYP